MVTVRVRRNGQLSAGTLVVFYKGIQAGEYYAINDYVPVV
jgi:hypothetical protein